MDVDVARGKANLKLSSISLVECCVQITGDDEGKPADTARLLVLGILPLSWDSCVYSSFSFLGHPILMVIGVCGEERSIFSILLVFLSRSVASRERCSMARTST